MDAPPVGLGTSMVSAAEAAAAAAAAAAVARSQTVWVA
jgi:hypothetical protein